MISKVSRTNRSSVGHFTIFLVAKIMYIYIIKARRLSHRRFSQPILALCCRYNRTIVLLAQKEWAIHPLLIRSWIRSNLILAKEINLRFKFSKTDRWLRKKDLKGPCKNVKILPFQITVFSPISRFYRCRISSKMKG